MPPLSIFVSYTGADRTWAEWIAWTLEAAGWVDPAAADPAHA
ncbi:MAG TPA: toll/interleukin-1 receptor domain-containing protein [Thermoanaerobaculia bacterium]|nr:toll/interleukin-1 receptor domain-containing protein [Thermoanaerobaculia bacterium]